MAEAFIAYCGEPPTPAVLLSAWNLDPPLLVALALCVPLIHRFARVPAAGWGAWALAVLVFVSPLCSLSAALFSARVVHHVLLVVGVAPLLVVTFPQLNRMALPSGAVFLAHLLALWAWHAPGPYGWALSTTWGYWLMQVTLLLTAWALWREVLREGEPGGPLALLVGTVAHMGLLGALIVFAPVPLYAAHFATTEPWGLSALSDQQLAGLLMWVPAILPYLGVGLRLAFRMLPEEAG